MFKRPLVINPTLWCKSTSAMLLILPWLRKVCQSAKGLTLLKENAVSALMAVYAVEEYLSPWAPEKPGRQ